MNESEVAIYLGQKGYSIKKENMEVKEQLALRKDLMVKPFVPKSSMAKAVEFPLYRESKKKFYIPRYYGLETYGKYEMSKIEECEKIDLKFIDRFGPDGISRLIRNVSSLTVKFQNHKV